MIDPLGPESEAPGPTVHRPAVVDGDLSFDLERLTATMAMLEKYVDSLLASDGGPLAVDPEIEDDDITARMACL